MLPEEPQRRKAAAESLPGTTSVPIAPAPPRGRTVIRASRGGGGGYTTCAFIMGVTTLVVLFTLAYTLGSSREVKRREITLQLSAARMVGLDKRLDDCTSQQTSLVRALRSPMVLLSETVAAGSPTKEEDETARAASTTTNAPAISDDELISYLQTQKENIEGDLANVDVSIKNEATTHLECKMETTTDREGHLGAAVINVTEYLLQLDADQKVLSGQIQTMGGVRARREVDMRSLIRAYELEITALLKKDSEKNNNQGTKTRSPRRNRPSRSTQPPVDRAQIMKDAYFAGKLAPRYRSYMKAVFGDPTTITSVAPTLQHKEAAMTTTDEAPLV